VLLVLKACHIWPLTPWAMQIFHQAMWDQQSSISLACPSLSPALVETPSNLCLNTCLFRHRSLAVNQS